MNELVARWCDLLALGAVQNVPVLLAALLLDRVFARCAWPGPRRVVWWGCLLELLVPAALGSPVHFAGRAAVAVPVDAVAPAALPWWLSCVWLSGAVLCSGRAWLRARALRRFARRAARPLPPWARPLLEACAQRVGLRRPPRVVCAAGVRSCVFGALRPVVLLDAALLAPAAGEHLEHALLHELGHVRRRDPLRAACVHLLSCGWWFHPTAWIAARRLALLREVGCDALVARVLGARAAYCRTLLAHAVGAVAAPFARPMAAPTAALGLVRLPAEVVQRVAALRHRDRGARWLRSLSSSTAAAALLLCCVPLTARLPTPTFSLPSLDEPGCLLRRYLVLGQLRDERDQTPTDRLTPRPQKEPR